MINSTLWDYIQQLSAADQKTTIEKCLKTTEEVGELARKVLPWGTAHATNHRFVSQPDLVEEIADIILTVLSVGYDIGMTKPQLESMILEKAKYWQQRQIAEQNIDFKKIPFEIHITVEQANVVSFMQTCKNLNVKPILLDLYLKDSVVNDMQTSSIFVGDNAEVYEEMTRISRGLIQDGYHVIRQKIETVPWHPMAPARYLKQNQQLVEIQPPMIMPLGCYFECHFGVTCDQNSLDLLQQTASRHNAHLSKNAFKKINDQQFVIMVTLRQYDGFREDFEIIRETLSQDLQKFWTLDKTITEFSIYDTRVQHDASWINS